MSYNRPVGRGTTSYSLFTSQKAIITSNQTNWKLGHSKGALTRLIHKVQVFLLMINNILKNNLQVHPHKHMQAIVWNLFACLFGQ